MPTFHVIKAFLKLINVHAMGNDWRQINTATQHLLQLIPRLPHLTAIIDRDARILRGGDNAFVFIQACRVDIANFLL